MIPESSDYKPLLSARTTLLNQISNREDEGTDEVEKLSFSQVFCGSQRGELYRLLAYKDFSESDSQQSENFSLHGQLQIALVNKHEPNTLVDLTLLIFMCKS